jgi:uncharacterized protein (DUF433 family)
MNSETIQIVDRGRGPQLSTSRITVLDLVHYFQRGASYQEIIRWIPTLTYAEIALVERYYLEHKDEFDEKECRVQEYRKEQIRQQRLRFPEEDRETRLARMKELLRQRQQEANGEGHSG